MNEATSLTSSYDNPGNRKLARTRIRAVRSRCSRRARERRCGESQLPLRLVSSLQSGGLTRGHSNWISTHPTTAAAHQEPAATDPKLQFQTAWLQYCHGTPGLQEVLTECVAGTPASLCDCRRMNSDDRPACFLTGPEQKTVTSISFPFPHAKEPPEQNSEARFWAAAIDAQADDAQAYSKIIASEGSIVVSTAGKLVKSELESMGLEVVLHVGIQLWFIGGEAMVILRQGDVL